jgi:hypothetical protein
MNRVRLKDLMDAWRFLFFHVCHPYGDDAEIELFDKWSENQASLFSGSRWLSRGVDHWWIRLKTGQQLQFHLSDEQDNSGQLRSLSIDLWRLIRECKIAENGEPGQHAPRKRHFAKAYSELQLHVEFLSICLKDDLPIEVQRWLRFIRWQNGRPFRIRDDPEVRSSVEDCCELAGPARRPLELPQFGVKPVEIIDSQNIFSQDQRLYEELCAREKSCGRLPRSRSLTSMVTTIAERIVKRHLVNHLRFKHARKIRQSEAEEEPSPLTSSESDEDLQEQSVNPYEELFSRDESDCHCLPRLLPSSFGGIRILRKRWLSILDSSVLYGPYSFAVQTRKLLHERKYHFLKERLQLIPDEDPSGSAIALPPIRTLDFVEWNSYDEENDPGFLFMNEVPSPVCNEAPPTFLLSPAEEDSDHFDELISPCSAIPKGDCTVSVSPDRVFPCSVIPKGDCTVPEVPVPEVVTSGVVSDFYEVSVNAPEDSSDYSNDSLSCDIDESFKSDQE